MAMLRSHWWLSLLVLAASNIATADDQRQGRFCWGPREREYKPATNHYVIVHPVDPIECRKPGTSRPCTWPMEQVSVDPYPYGWFGARTTLQPSRRGSYYGDTIDYRRTGNP